MKNGRKPLALTVGEPAGIGLDITIMAWLAREAEEIPPFIFVGDGEVLVRRAEAMGQRIRVIVASPADAPTVFAEAIPCMAEAPRLAGEPGQVDSGDTDAVVQSIRTSVAMVRSGDAAAVVTNPVQKKVLDAAGFGFPGHTEYLGTLTKELFGHAATPVMMLAGPQLRVVPVTVHIPLAEVPARLTTELIVETGTIVARELFNRFGIARPRLALAGLNPHAGEDGMLGGEDEAVVRPAVEALVQAGIAASGPRSADALFHEQARESYDAALCMYHDQALIPIKTLAFDESVNVTLGLPFIRTSPDHGTALPLAGTGRARAASLIVALKMADELARAEVNS